MYKPMHCPKCHTYIADVTLPLDSMNPVMWWCQVCGEYFNYDENALNKDTKEDDLFSFNCSNCGEYYTAKLSVQDSMFPFHCYCGVSLDPRKIYFKRWIDIPSENIATKYEVNQHDYERILAWDAEAWSAEEWLWHEITLLLIEG